MTVSYDDIANKAYDLVGLKDSMSRLYSWHSINRTRVIGDLNPGLNDGELDQFEARLGYKLPLELREIYKWRNGTRSDAQLIWYHRMIPLDEAVNLIGKIKGVKVSEWDKNWLPIFEYQSEFYFIKLSKDRVNASPVFLAFPYQDAMPAYINITMLLKTAAEILESGEVEAEDTGYLVSGDTKKIAFIYNKYNTGMNFPYR